MSTKILLADDSPTIQKVINITLSNEDYEIDICSSGNELEDKISQEKYELVLLDFGLSDDKSGYELCKDIKEKSSETKILMMFGTFDSVEEHSLKEVGCEGKIVKPFDSTKFVNLCRGLVSESDDKNDEFIELDNNMEEAPENEELLDDSADQWEQGPSSAAKEIDEDELENAEEIELEEISSDENNDNALDKELGEWGMEIPPIINGTDSDLPKDVPPIIDAPEEVPALDSSAELPKSDDLEFPDIDETKKKIETEYVTENEDQSFFDEPGSSKDKLSGVKLTSKLVPLSDMNRSEDVTDEFVIEDEGTSSEEEVSEIEKVVENEIEEDDFWAVDEKSSDSISEEPIEEELEKSDEVTAEFKFDKSDLDDIDIEEDVQLEESSLLNDTAKSELEEKIKIHMKPVVEEFVKEYCKETIEKVAWEIIPDLAENLIKEELNRLAEAVNSES